MKYNILPVEYIDEAYRRSFKSLPDILKKPGVFATMVGSRSTVLFELGDFDGVFWLSDLIIGWKANIHIVIWGKDSMRRYTEAIKILEDILRLFLLKRIQAFIPVHNKLACHYAEKMGFRMEGVLRKVEIYDGEAVDVCAYGLLKEDL